MAKNRNSYYDHEFSLFHHIMFLKKRTKIVFFAVQEYSPLCVKAKLLQGPLQMIENEYVGVSISNRMFDRTDLPQNVPFKTAGQWHISQ